MQLIDGRPVYAATDLVGFLACSHRLALERAALAGLVDKPIRADPQIELIAQRGLAHERRYRDELVASGRSVVEIQPDGSVADRGEQLRSAAAATIEALRSGVDVVYQATFFDGRWVGFADFLLRVERPSALGAWSYEVADTKLARHVKGSAVLQMCSYVEQLQAIQGLQPEWLRVVLGGSAHAIERLRVADYMAYYRRVKTEFEAAVAAGEPIYPVTATYPDPVEHCDVCRWVVQCKAQRRSDDDLSLVAGITARQRRELKARDVRRRRELAGLELPMQPRLEGVSREALRRVRDQARIQVEGEDRHAVLWSFLDMERDAHGELVPDRGFLVLPEPSPNDLFFDIEGDPFALEDGVEYLFGVLEPAIADPDRGGAPWFHEIWSRDATGAVTLPAEKAAFEALVDLLIARLDADPSLHVYHYAAYEKTALAKLAQRHGTREEEVDRLLRGRVLVDLYRVVRQGIRASVESYSIKRLEPLYGLEREVELKSATSSILAFEAWLEGGPDENGEVGEAILRSIADYNRDDVLSNWRLRDWLEARRIDLERQLGQAVPRPPAHPEAEAPKPLSPERQHVAVLVEALSSGVPADAADRSPAEHGRWLLAQLLGFHRREENAFWWRFFELAGMTDDELVDAREPIGHLEFVEDLGPVGRGSRLERYRFPLQDHVLKVGRSVDDPARVGNETASWSCGTVDSIDEVGLTLVLRRGPKQLEGPQPKALIPDERVPTAAINGSLVRTAEWILERGIESPGPGQAARDLLLRRPPRLPDDVPLRRTDEPSIDAARRLGRTLDESVLAIQGPPGSGKTSTAAEMIVALVADGRRVGITANSHKVIGNALDAVDKAATKAGTPLRLGQRCADDEEPTSRHAKPLRANDVALQALVDGEVDVLGGTAWLWSRPEFAGVVDMLFVDEAGQFSLANAVAVASAGGSMVLLGDPQQLEQPLQGSHPPGAERSALGHILDGRPVIGAGDGLFLELTWRLHPDIAAYTSPTFYADQLSSGPTLERQAVAGRQPLAGTGMRWLPVIHGGDATESIDEADAIATLVAALLEDQATWTDRWGAEHPIGLEDVVIVAPYNAHVERIAKSMADRGYSGARVGTVDKFQGQEAPISIYAMASSTPEDAPRGMEFLYSLNRLNVATSRAQCVAAVVASPALVRVACRTPRQMQLANALCRLVEIAEEQSPPIEAKPPRRVDATEVQLSWLDPVS
ncbi:MAG TPA: TM0106 family RecB-like putative nuclease [Candidatus Dormibacteraeota bacterium]|nr:TM0106 family RecB-like putative nuclease [Candidatus Dormibacteraeota bacterium]